MPRYDLRWLRRHPLRWLRIMWFPWVLAAVFAVLAKVVAEPVFFVTVAAGYWPILFAFTAGTMLASAFAPLEPRLQAFTASFLFGISTLRVLTYVDTFLRGSDLSPNARAVVIAFGLHWTLIAAAAYWWPLIIEDAGRRMAVEAGRDDRAG